MAGITEIQLTGGGSVSADCSISTIGRPHESSAD